MSRTSTRTTALLRPRCRMCAAARTGPTRAAAKKLTCISLVTGRGPGNFPSTTPGISDMPATLSMSVARRPPWSAPELFTTRGVISISMTQSAPSWVTGLQSNASKACPGARRRAGSPPGAGSPPEQARHRERARHRDWCCPSKPRFHRRSPSSAVTLRRGTGRAIFGRNAERARSTVEGEPQEGGDHGRRLGGGSDDRQPRHSERARHGPAARRPPRQGPEPARGAGHRRPGPARLGQRRLRHRRRRTRRGQRPRRTLPHGGHRGARREPPARVHHLLGRGTQSSSRPTTCTDRSSPTSTTASRSSPRPCSATSASAPGWGSTSRPTRCCGRSRATNGPTPATCWAPPKSSRRPTRSPPSAPPSA